VPSTWYRRNDNNGWRLVVSLTEADEIKSKSSGPRHFSKTRRAADAALLRKQRKREWLLKMYSQGLAKERGVGAEVSDLGDAMGYHDGTAMGAEADARGTNRPLFAPLSTACCVLLVERTCVFIGIHLYVVDVPVSCVCVCACVCPI
jgi:hypothetical protein